MHPAPHTGPKVTVRFALPHRVAFGEVIKVRDHTHALACMHAALQS